MAQQRPDGLWPDPGSTTGEGAAWITGLVGRSAWALLADEPRADGLEDALERAFYALTSRQRANGGWASSESAGTDAEATAWALVCLLSDRRRVMYSTSRAHRYLYSHWHPASGTFGLHVTLDDQVDQVDQVDQAPAERSRGASTSESSPAPSYVTALVLRALLMGGDPGPAVGQARDYIATAQGSDGLWRSPLWNVVGLPTLNALMTLGMVDGLDESVRAQAAAGVGRLLGSLDPFESASAVVASLQVGLGDAVGEPIERLLEAQEADGGWTPLVGVRNAADSPEDGRLLTTTMALIALHFSSH